VFVLKALKQDDIVTLLENALRNPEGFGKQTIKIGQDEIQAIANFADGDARTALNTLEMAILNGDKTADATTVNMADLSQLIAKKFVL